MPFVLYLLVIFLHSPINTENQFLTFVY